MIYYNDKDTTCGEPIAVLLGRKSIRSSRRSKLRAAPLRRDGAMTKYKLTYDEARIIVMSLIELKNQLISEGRRTDAIDELLIKFVE